MLKIIYTKTDEAPALATAFPLPILQAFTKSSKKLNLKPEIFHCLQEFWQHFNDFWEVKLNMKMI